MAAPVPPALMEQQSRGHEAGPILTELSAALESPDIKALEWAEDRRGVMVHTMLYEGELAKNKELFPALMGLGSVPALQAWLLAHGFRLEETKTHVLVLQHPDFQRVHPTAMEPGTPRGDARPSARQQNKSKKRSSTSKPQPCKKVAFPDALGRLRPLYQYINLDAPEPACPSEKEVTQSPRASSRIQQRFVETPVQP